MAAPHATLEVRGLCILRGEERIVDGFDWAHSAGRVAWLTGPNGAGKSSILRVLAGVAAPHAGEVRRTVPGRAQTGRESIGYYNPSMGLPPESRAAAFHAMSSRLVAAPLPLAPGRELRSKRASALSTGEEKRLLLGPILARARPFLFLDEPYEHLSRDARSELTAELVRHAETSVVVVATNQPIPSEAAGPVITLSMEAAPHVA